jgi:hypothetical protein
MSDDFDDFGADNFFADDAATLEDRPLGLVVPHTARVITDAKGELIDDELAVLEARMSRIGRPVINFIEETEPEA